MVPAFFRVALRRILILLAAYSFRRVFFLYWNWESFAESRGELWWAFVLGLRFDLSGILLTMGPAILLWLAPGFMWQKR